jgi:hypothetical protein
MAWLSIDLLCMLADRLLNVSALRAKQPVLSARLCGQLDWIYVDDKLQVVAQSSSRLFARCDLDVDDELDRSRLDDKIQSPRSPQTVPIDEAPPRQCAP